MANNDFDGFVFDLQLFAEGGGNAGGGEGAGESAVSPAAAAIARRAEAEKKKDPYADVKFGRQPEADADAQSEPDGADGGEETAAAETPEERAARFDALIKGEFKDLYGKKVSHAVQDRLKGVSSKAEKYDQLEGSLGLLAAKYGVDPTDAKALADAISGDDSFYEDEALESGVSVERLKAEKLAEAENRRLNAQIDEMKRREAAKALYERWLGEAEEAKKIYPSFDLETEIRDERFASLIRNNVDVRSAYEVVHMGELVPAVIKTAERKEGERIASKYAQNARRPAENGSSSQGAAVVKSDPTALTKAEREEVARRVARGERISF